ncbi:MAG: Lnb N-terminal periplasmic domain-containing protein [Geminicoccaceae bacterium]
MTPGRTWMGNRRQSDPAISHRSVIVQIFLTVIITMTWLGAKEARGASDYLDELISKADILKLAERPAWHALGHYRKGWPGQGRRSVIDSEGFFLAADGKHNPSSELEATLRAFFALAEDRSDREKAADDNPSPDDQHPQCAFTARYHWLKARLDFDPDRLPEQTCPVFETWSETIDATSATLIFPAAYLNNPASMFGHTLLRFDRPNQTEETRLLSYAVNYGAETETNNGLLFAVLGLTGGYPGTYSVEPYHHLVKRYSDIENRNIWEYQLDFSTEEVARMVAHLWEMRGHHSDYYFFDENCSFQLLFLLDTARPGLGLVDDFFLHVIPVDSVRSVLSRKGLLRRTVFRPSGETRVQHGLASMTAAERDLVQQLAAASITPEDEAIANLPEPREAAILELAEAFVTHELKTGALVREAAAPRAWSLLAARSHVETRTDQPPVTVPHTRPDQGHGSARFAAGIGVRDGRNFQAFRLRPAYHDVLDPGGGYVPGASIEFLDTELRHYQGDNKFLLDRLTGIGIRSMTPRDKLIRPISWKLNVGLERMRIENTDEEGALVAAARGGAGLSYSLGRKEIWSATLDAGVTGGEDCDQTCSFNVGPGLALLWPITDRATFSADARYQFRFGEDVDDRYEISLGQSYGFVANLSIKFEAALEDEGGGAQSEFLSSLNWYF